VSGVSTGTAVLAASYAFIPGCQAVSNLTAYTATPPVSTAPASNEAYVWCSLPSLGTGDGVAFKEELEKQGFHVRWREDADGMNTSDFGSCTLANYRQLANSGAFTVISHGRPGKHLIVYAPGTPAGKAACETWRNGDTNLIVEYYVNVMSCVVADSSWLAANFKTSLDNNEAIAVWSICYSAATTDELGNPAVSVKEAAGGRWRVGYELPTDATEAENVNHAFFGRMNGVIADGSLRTAGEAYADPAADYRRIGPTVGSVKMDGNAWTTLCPAPLLQTPFYPATSAAGQVKGWGCFLLDTYLDVAVPAGEAMLEPLTADCSGFRWLATPSGGHGLGFNFEKQSSGFGGSLLIDAEKVRNAGVDGRKMDGNRIAPNGDPASMDF
jgi:hypothetical protein